MKKKETSRRTGDLNMPKVQWHGQPTTMYDTS